MDEEEIDNLIRTLAEFIWLTLWFFLTAMLAASGILFTYDLLTKGF